MLEVAYRLWNALKMHLALTGEINGDECVACESRDVEETGEGTYRCRGCGYEGGPGMAEKMAQEKRAQLEALGPREKRGRARANLEEARLLVSSGLAEVSRAKTLGLLDIAGLNMGEMLSGRPEGADKFRSLANAMRSLLEARELVADSSILLGEVLGGEDAKLEGPGMLLSGADVWADNAGFDALTQVELATVHTDAKRLEAIIEESLRRHFA